MKKSPASVAKSRHNQSMMISSLVNFRLPRWVRLACILLLAGFVGAGPARVAEPVKVVYVHAARAEPVSTVVVAPVVEALSKSVVPHVHEKRTILMEVTAYCPCELCCGPNAIGLTASGKHVSYNDGRFVAADTDVLPFGTKLSIPGYCAGEAVEVIDRGGAIKGNKLDVYFDDHQTALEWGRRMVEVGIGE